jgi:hypothetical protein
MMPKNTKSAKMQTIQLGKPKPATKKAVDKALKEGMKRYKNALKELAKS